MCVQFILWCVCVCVMCASQEWSFMAAYIKLFQSGYFKTSNIWTSQVVKTHNTHRLTLFGKTHKHTHTSDGPASSLNSSHSSWPNTGAPGWKAWEDRGGGGRSYERIGEVKRKGMIKGKDLGRRRREGGGGGWRQVRGTHPLYNNRLLEEGRMEERRRQASAHSDIEKGKEWGGMRNPR